MTLAEFAIRALNGGLMTLWAVEGTPGVRASYRQAYDNRLGPSLTVQAEDVPAAMRAVVAAVGWGGRN